MNTFSIILETENLGMASLGELELSLKSLEDQKYPIRNAKEVLMIVGTHLSKKGEEYLRKKYPWITVKKVKEKLDYVGAKAVGSTFTKSDILIFVDSDSIVEDTWLGNMLKVISDYPEADVVVGDFGPIIDSSYAMAMAIGWMFIVRGPMKKPVRVNHIPMNNFAVKRKVLSKVPLPKNLPFYRSGSIWKNWLLEKGFIFYAAPNARGNHALPGNLRDWWYRLLINGRDFVALGDYETSGMKIVERKNVLKRIRNLILWIGWKTTQIFVNAYRVVAVDKKTARYLPLGIPLALINIAILGLGSVITVFNRDYIYNLVAKYEAGHIA